MEVNIYKSTPNNQKSIKKLCQFIHSIKTKYIRIYPHMCIVNIHMYMCASPCVTVSTLEFTAIGEDRETSNILEGSKSLPQKQGGGTEEKMSILPRGVGMGKRKGCGIKTPEKVVQRSLKQDISFHEADEDGRQILYQVIVCKWFISNR